MYVSVKFSLLHLALWRCTLIEILCIQGNWKHNRKALIIWLSCIIDTDDTKVQNSSIPTWYVSQYRVVWHSSILNNLMTNVYVLNSLVPHTAKLSNWKTFVAVHNIHYPLENFPGTSGHGHHVLYTARDSRGKLLWSTEKLQKFSQLKVLLHTVLILR